MLRPAMIASFLKKINKTDSCWIWTACTNGKYGVLGLNDGTRYYAHRFSYELFFGQPPGDKCVCHRCDNRLCVNPYHLFLGTYRDNVHDMINKGRAAFGERHPGAKLNEEQVRKIKLLLAQGTKTRATIGALFGVTRENVDRIARNKIWKTVTVNKGE